MAICLRATLFLLHFVVSGNSSVVECDLAKVDVAGSNPVSRSIFFTDSLSFIDGAVAKW
jgi:hypothetical protein